MPGPVDVLDAGEAATPASGPEVAAGAQDEVVQSVGGIGVILAQPVIDQHGQPERITEPDARIDHGIVSRPQCLL